MKVLVVFYSRSGQTKKVAENLANNLKSDMEEIIDLTDRSGIKGWLLGGRDAMKGSLTEIKVTKNPKNYDLVIIGTPIWAGKEVPAVKSYVAKFKKEIKNLVVFSTAHVNGVKKAIRDLEKVWGKKISLSEGWITADFEDHERCLKKTTEFLEKIKKA